VLGFIGIVVFALSLDFVIWILTWTDDPRNPAAFSYFWAAVLSVLLLGCVIAAGIPLLRYRQSPSERAEQAEQETDLDQRRAAGQVAETTYPFERPKLELKATGKRRVFTCAPAAKAFR
jgi:hypothetical protein